MSNLQAKEIVSKLLLLSALVFTVVISISAQRYSIKTSDGYLFIQNGKDVSFSFEVKGSDIKPVEAGENPAFDTNGSLIQILWVVSNNYEPTGKIEEARLLEYHRDWELDYLTGIFGTKLESETEKLSVNEKPVMFWQFKRTKYLTEYDRDIYLTTLIGRDVFGLSSPAKIGVNSKVYKDRHLEVMKTLKISKTPFDILKLSEEIKKGAKPKP